MTLSGSLVMLSSWAVIGQRIKTSLGDISPQIKMLQRFFLCMGLFCLAIFLPQIALNLQPTAFPKAMAWGYIVGHVALYIGLISVISLTFSMVPRLASKQKYAITIGIIMSVVITILTIKTMAFGTLPVYDAHRSVTLFNVAPVVGTLIALFATLSVLPAAILMILNGVRNPGARARSFLLGGGLFVIMTAGPLHDVAKGWQLYMIADIVSIVGFVFLAWGILYRFEERLAPSRTPAPATMPSARAI